MTTPIISIKPRYTRNIYLGNKTVELRKKIGIKFQVGNRIYIYSSSPVKKITGYATIQRIEQTNVAAIRENYLTQACIDVESFDAYYQGHQQGVLIWLENVVEFNQGPSLLQLRSIGFNPPQSFCYANQALEKLLKNTQ